LYAYTLSDPINFIDPFGLEADDTCPVEPGLEEDYISLFVGTFIILKSPEIAKFIYEGLKPLGNEGFAGPRKKPGKLGQFKGRDALRRENKMLKDALKAIGKYSKKNREILHSEITGQGLTYKQIVEIAKELFY